jgi:hypothetical protein
MQVWSIAFSIPEQQDAGDGSGFTVPDWMQHLPAEHTVSPLVTTGQHSASPLQVFGVAVGNTQHVSVVPSFLWQSPGAQQSSMSGPLQTPPIMTEHVGPAPP